METKKHKKPKHTLGAFAIIPNTVGHILLCHRTDFDAWNLPGGVVEHGESPWTAVVREVKEETGISVKVECLLGIYSKPDKQEVVFSFLCRILEGDLHLTDEADELAFFSPASLPANLLEKQRERIIDWQSNHKSIHMKEQISH